MKGRPEDESRKKLAREQYIMDEPSIAKLITFGRLRQQRAWEGWMEDSQPPTEHTNDKFLGDSPKADELTNDRSKKNV